MRSAFPFYRATVLCGAVLLGGQAWAQTQRSMAAEEASGASQPEEASASIPGEQARLLEDALERYREIERRGGWSKFTTEIAIGPPHSYPCPILASLERRLMAEGYLRRSTIPRPPPPPPGKPAKRSRNEPPPPPQVEYCKYGPALADAVKAFQLDRKILGNGQVGARTRAELNRPVQEIIDILEHDVERWRNVRLDPSGTYLLVNIPFYQLIAYQDGREDLRMDVIVGQPAWQTPQFSDELEYIVVNPDWGIPDTIAKLEYWPSARRDPKYLSRQGITATGGSLRQKPGPRNPLGRIKFVMPNTHDVYLHDTPEKRAFTAAVKALSHGCVRLSRPVDLGNYLLRDEPEWDSRRLQTSIASGKTGQINLRRRMPVHIVYSTSRVNDEGRVEIRPDVYGKNRRSAREREARPPASDESLEAWP